MKRFLVFEFCAYDGTDLEYAIQGMTDRLDSITERMAKLEDVMALDMRTGFIWQLHTGDKVEWKSTGNISEYPDLDAPVPKKEARQAVEEKEVPGGLLIPHEFRKRIIGSFLNGC